MALRVLVAVACIWAAALVGDLGVAVAVGIVLLLGSVWLGYRYDSALRHDISNRGSSA